MTILKECRFSALFKKPDETLEMIEPEYKHEPKACPRCQAVFECKVGNVEHCQCSKTKLTDDVQKYICETYSDCLCISCLNEIRSEQFEKTFYDRLKKIFGFRSTPDKRHIP